MRRAAIAILFTLALFICAGGSGPALAQLEDLNGNHDSQAPIKITADTLEVRQSENLAIFRGDVDAIQGEILLKADMLVVHYRENSDSPDAPGISQIDAEGNVFVSSPSETAQGKRGVYDVDKKMIWLSGDVILTQGDNIIEGEELELDLVSGKSKVMSAANENGERKRVRGMFVPKKEEN